MTHPDAQRAFEEMMPEPECYRNYWDEGITYSSEKEGNTSEALFSEDQLHTTMQAVWDAATERAAKVAPSYKIEDLVGTFQTAYKDGKKLETPVEEPWHDENAMIAHMLLNDVLWTRDAHYIGNKGSKFEFSGDGIIVLLNCNDVFAWGCADTEPLPHDKVPELFMLWHENHQWGAAKWCCFQRNEKPQATVARAMREAGIWCERMEALPENNYDKVCRERATAIRSSGRGEG